MMTCAFENAKKAMEIKSSKSFTEELLTFYGSGMLLHAYTKLF